MKALLTSSGLTNESIRAALTDLLGRPTSECTAVQVPTAVYGLPDGPAYATEMTRYWDALGWTELGTLELSTLPSLPEELWRPALDAADVLLVAGGNSGYLSYWAHHTRFAALLPELLEKTVYIGVSAGSCLLTPAYHYDADRLAATGIYYDDEYDEAAPPGAGDSRALGLVDVHLRPHLNSTEFGVDLSAAAMERAAAKVAGPLYAIDDQTALVVAEGDIRVVSEGDWLLFNAETEQEGHMIARVWRGLVHSDKLEEYVDIVEETGMDEYRRTPGNLGAQILTRDLGEGRSEIITISWWPDVDHVRGFAGEDIEIAKYYPSDDPYLIDRDDTVVHYEVASD